MAKLANMTDVSFSRFFKSRTGITFIDSLVEMRLGHASRLLIDTTQSVAEIAYNCGFNNISNFNRLFKRKKPARRRSLGKITAMEAACLFELT
ncbi:MAG: helix-turn-helix transcriptional regulator [Chitinophagaceae bacterium]|nr:helix-turn-helix transcriptional regulator [Chitinophagaceae bacterium]